MDCRSLFKLDGGDFIAEDEVGVGGEGVSCEEGHVLVREEDRVHLGLLEGSHELGLDLGLGLLEDHLSFDLGHLEVVLFLLNALPEVDLLDIEVGLGLDDLLSLLGELLLNLHLLLLRSNEVIDLQLLHLLKIAFDAFWNVRLGDPNGQYLNPRRPMLEILVQILDEFLIELIEDVDINLLQRMLRTKLVDLMMDLVRYPKTLVLLSVVQHGLINVLFFEFVDHLYLVEVDQCAVGGAAGNAGHHIGLDAHLHLDEFFVNGDSEVETRFTEGGLQDS